MDISEIIKTLGFPVFVAVFCLVRLDTTLKLIAENLSSLTNMIKDYVSSDKIKPQD